MSTKDWKVIVVNSINMSGFGQSMFSDNVKIRVGGKTITFGSSGQTQNKNNRFGIQQTPHAEQKNRNDNKLSGIIMKFNAGKKLSAKELAYLREHSPEMYKKVQQTLMEREMLERQMEQAKTKEQSNQVYMTALSAAMPTGTGGEGSGASVDVAKLNHFADAHRVYVASEHYKAKLDQSDMTEEQRMKQEEMAAKMEEQQAKLEESMEKSKEAMEEVDKLEKATKRKRRKIHAKRKRNNGVSATFHFNPLSEAEMREKLRELYAKKNEIVEGKKPSKKDGSVEKKNMADGTILSDGHNASSALVTGIESTSVGSVGTASVGTTIDISL